MPANIADDGAGGALILIARFVAEQFGVRTF